MKSLSARIEGLEQARSQGQGEVDTLAGLSDYELMVRMGQILGLDTSSLSKTPEESAARGYPYWGAEVAELAGFSSWEELRQHIMGLLEKSIAADRARGHA